MRKALLLVAAALIAGGCGAGETTFDDSPLGAGSDDPTVTGATVDPLDGFFSLNKVHTIDITLDSTGVAALKDEPKTYVKGSVTVDDSSYAQVGLRLKGNAGSFIPIGGTYPEAHGEGNCRPGKSAFIIDFNRYVKNTNHLGLKKLTVNNMVQDFSYMHEYLGYSLFREGKVPASRTGYAAVKFNGKDMGLYALIETPDNAEFLKKHFGTAKGNLYEGEYGADFRSESYQDFDQDRGEDKSKSDLKQLVAALDAVGDSGDPTAVLQKYFDLDKFAAFAATEGYIGHWDGYLMGANNYAVYHNTKTGKWTFLPWGLDQTFIGNPDELRFHMQSLDGYDTQDAEEEFMHHGGRIHGLCKRSAMCLAKLRQAYQDLATRIESMGLSTMAANTRTLVESYVLSEAQDTETAKGALSSVQSFIPARTTVMKTMLLCLDGQSVDQDGDGFDACVDDCDDSNAAANPHNMDACPVYDDGHEPPCEGPDCE